MISASSRRLSVFKSVVDLGGFNAAATRLGIAQPSVGAHVKALENQIGQPLFHRRRGARPQLTPAGETLYAFALDTLRKAQETSHALAEMKAAQDGEIILAAHRDVATTFLPGRLAVFARKYPRARIVTRIGTVEEVLDLVRQDHAHLGLVLSSGPIAGFQSHVLAHEPIELVVSPRHPLAGVPAVTADILTAYPFVTGLRGSRYFQMVDFLLRRIGLFQYEVAMELQESTPTKGVVAHCNAIACLPRRTVYDELQSGRLAALRLATPVEDLELRCLYRTLPSELAGKFLAHLRV
jgi:DNA-binding transcriptional LysR family regulator